MRRACERLRACKREDREIPAASTKIKQPPGFSGGFLILIDVCEKRTRGTRGEQGKRLYGQKLKNRREKMADAIAWLLGYNRTRLHSTVAYVSPLQFEQNWLANPRRAAASFDAID